jgi:hypothetical protein
MKLREEVSGPPEASSNDAKGGIGYIPIFSFQ